MGTLLGIMNSKADDLNTFLESLQDREIYIEDVAHIWKLRDVLEAKYAKVESKWESLSEEVEDPFVDQKEHDKCRGDYEETSVTLKKHLKAAKNALDRDTTQAVQHQKVILIVQVVVEPASLNRSSHDPQRLSLIHI